jgi:DNA-directed RNA polymerase specialized sigma24 family protein
VKIGPSSDRRVADREAFVAFVREVEPRLRRALVAAYGPDRGREATAEALAYAWEHWARVRAMGNPAGYLYRVGQSRSRPRRRPPLFAAESSDREPMVEPGLMRAMADLSEQQRVCVVLTQAYGWQLAEVGELLGVSVSTVQTHAQRGMDKLRSALEVTDCVGD